MERLKRLCTRLFCLSARQTLWIAVPSLTFCFVMLGTGDHGSLAYISYGLSAYGTALLVILLVRRVRRPSATLPLPGWLRDNPLCRRFLENAIFRSEVSLYAGLILNCIYVLMKLFSGIYYRSLWFAALSIYYLFLAAMRFSLLRHVRRSPVGQEYRSELRRYRFCGGMLAAMNLALGGITAMVVIENRSFDYPGTLIYVMALYAFYAVISSAVNVVKYRRYNSPVLSAAKALSLTAALVSMLSLETAMLARFNPAEDSAFRRTMTAITGFVVVVLVFAMSVYMIASANRKLKQGGLSHGRKAGIL